MYLNTDFLKVQSVSIQKQEAFFPKTSCFLPLFLFIHKLRIYYINLLHTLIILVGNLPSIFYLTNFLSCLRKLLCRQIFIPLLLSLHFHTAFCNHGNQFFHLFDFSGMCCLVFIQFFLYSSIDFLKSIIQKNDFVNELSMDESSCTKWGIWLFL